MKKNLILNAIFIAFFSLLLPNFSLLAQSIDISETPPTEMTVCMGDYPFSVTFTNNTGGNISDINVMLNLPDYITYTGNLSPNATVIDTTNLNEPILHISSLADGDQITISYTATASCDIIPNIINNTVIQNSYGFTYNDGTGVIPQTASVQNSYNLLYADLSLSVDETPNLASPVNIGDHYFYSPNGYRTIHITNESYGSIDTVVIRITPEPEIEYNLAGFLGGNFYIPLTNIDTIGGEIIIKIAGADFANCGAPGDSIFGPNEALQIIEDFTVVSCVSGDTYYKLEWGCGGQVCNENDINAITNSTITVNSQEPDIDVVMATNPATSIANYCGEDGYLEWWFVNNGASPNGWATNFKPIITYTGSMITLSNFTINGGTVIENGVNGMQITSIIDSLYCDGTNPPGTVLTSQLVFDFSSFNLLGTELQDIDNDGFFDDLEPDDTLKIRYQVHIKDSIEFFDLCAKSSLSLNFGGAKVQYGSLCDNSYCKNELALYEYNIYGGNSYADAPSDFVQGTPETFTFCNVGWLKKDDIMKCDTNRYFVEIDLPDGYELSGTGNPIWISSLTADTTNLTTSQNGNLLTIEGGGIDPNNPNSPQSDNGCYQVDLQLFCEGNTSQTSTLNFNLFYKCSDCDSVELRACETVSVYNHFECDTSDCPGIATTYFDLERTSLGWMDYTQTTKVNRLTPGINLDAAYPCDSTLAKVGGSVGSTDFTNAFVEISYQGGIGIFNVPEGTFHVYRSGALIETCSGVTPVYNTSTGNTTYTFQLPSVCQDSLQVGDSIVFEDNFVVINNLASSLNNREIPNFRARFYTVKGSDSITCDTWGEDFKLYVPFVTYDVRTNGQACDERRVTLNMYYNSMDVQVEDFPHEFRNIARLDDTIKFLVPEGYSYEQDSAYYNYYSTVYSTNGISSAIIDSSVYINPVSTNGDTLYFYNQNWPILDGYRHYPYTVFNIKLKPNCDAPTSSTTGYDFNFNDRDYSDECGRHVFGSQSGQTNITNDHFDNISILFRKPNLETSIVGVLVEEAVTNMVDYTVKICNFPNTANPNPSLADNVWLDVDQVLGNVGDIEFVSLTPIPASNVDSIYTDVNGESIFAEVGQIPVNQCRTLVLKVKYYSCQTDSTDNMQIFTGWSCDGYPNPTLANQADCHADTTNIGILYRNANLQLQSLVLPSGNEGFCDTFHYQFKLVSSSPANMYDVDFWLNLPTGVTVINPEFSYPDSLTWINLPSPSSAYPLYNPIGWKITDLNQIVLLNVTNPPDSSLVGSRQPNLNDVWVRFDLILDCNFTGDQPLKVNADGITNCNDTINRIDEQFINVNGFTNLVEYEIDHIQLDTISCDGDSTITFKVKNISPFANQLGDSIQIELPANFSYIANSASPTNAVNVGNIVKWSVGLLNSGDSTAFSIQVNSAIVGCDSVAFPATIFRNIIIGCLGCDTITKVWQDTLNTVYCCNPCNIVASWIADTVCLGDSTCFQLLDQTTIGADYIHSWDFGDGNGSTEPEPCHIYAQEGIYMVCHTVTQISTGCKATDCHEVEVVEEAHGSIVLLGCNPFCEGDTVYLTINGEYTSIEWVNVTTGINLGSYDTLAVTTSGTYTAVLGNGYCVDSCLSITLTAIPRPEIEIPDTMVCDSSTTVLLDAGFGYTSYLWSTGDTTQFITVGPGIYWVKVGEQLPYGCCSCYGIDTVIVRVSDLEVELRDTSLCFGDSLTLVPIVTGGVPPYTYLWNTNETTPTIVVTTSGQYWVEVTDAMLCTDRDTANITVALPPNAEFTYDDTICINDTACYVAVDTGIDEWYIFNASGDTITSFGDVSSICYHYPAIGTYTVQHILTNACGSDTVTHVIVVVPPIEACIVMIGQNPFCIGDEVCLTINDPLNQVTSVDWYLDSVFVGSMDTLCVTTPGTYRAMVEDENGCTSACMCIVLTQAPQPVVDLPDSINICDTNSVTLTAPSGFDEYIWSKDGQFIAYGDSSISVNEEGTYTLVVRDENGCEATDSTIVNQISPLFRIQPPITVCRDEPFTLTVDCSLTSTYSWEFRRFNDLTWSSISNDDTCSLSLNGSIMNLPGQYFFRVTAVDQISGCIQTGIFTVFHIVNCTEAGIFPNPVNGNSTQIFYNFNGMGISSAILEVRDLRGQIIDKIDLDINSQYYNLDVTNYANGLYQVYQFIDGKFESVTQMIIAK